MAVDATVGGPASNSYGTNQQADDYFADHPYADAWARAGETSPPKQDALLIQATYWLDQREPEMTGRRASQTQALAFPRVGCRDADGSLIPPDVVPVFVRRAQFEAALALARGNLLADTGLEGFTRAKVGPLEVELVQGRVAGVLPAHVARYLAPVLSVGPMQFRVRRG